MLKKITKLNDQDLKLIRLVFQEEIDNMVRKLIKEEVGYLPTKDEFYTAMDKIMGELKAIREEQAMLTQHDVYQHDRLDRLEDIHPGYTHS